MGWLDFLLEGIVMLRRPRGPGGVDADNTSFGAVYNSPRKFVASLLMGFLLWEQGEYDIAKIRFQEAHALDPLSLEAKRALGIMMILTASNPRAMEEIKDIHKYYEEAVDNLQPLLEQSSPQNPITEMIKCAAIEIEDDEKGILIRGLLNLERADEAIAITSFWIIADPQNGYLYYYRGIGNRMVGKYKESVEDFNKTLEFHQDKFDLNKINQIPYYDLIDVYFQLAITYRDAGLYDQALIELDRAFNSCIKLESSSNDVLKMIQGWHIAEIHYYRGSVQFSAGLIKEALVEINQAIETSDSNENYYDLRAKIHTALGETEKAEEDLEKTMKIRKQDSR